MLSCYSSNVTTDYNVSNVCPLGKENWVWKSSFSFSPSLLPNLFNSSVFKHQDLIKQDHNLTFHQLSLKEPECLDLSGFFFIFFQHFFYFIFSVFIHRPYIRGSVKCEKYNFVFLSTKLCLFSIVDWRASQHLYILPFLINRKLKNTRWLVTVKRVLS